MSSNAQGMILLVEDNPDDRDLTIRALRRNRVTNEIVVARDGSEALAILFRGARTLPCMVLLDLKLPKVNGLEVLARYERTAEPGLPVVLRPGRGARHG